MIEWKEYKVIGKHPYIKNKKVKAIFVTKENAQQVSDETRAFSLFNETTLLVGIMNFRKVDSWMININPRGKIKKYIFESDRRARKVLDISISD